MTSLSVAICAHKSRRSTAIALSHRLGQCPISMDEGDVGSVANHDATLELAAKTTADWVIAVEDDADPIPQFFEQAPLALDACPAPFASLYFGYVGAPYAPMQTILNDDDPHWVMCTGWDNAVCLAVRHELVAPLLEAAQDLGDDLPADHRYAAAAAALGHVWIPHSYPSLVDHNDMGSLIAGPGPYQDFRRRAYKVGIRPRWTDKSTSHV